MATCKGCIHYEVCNVHGELFVTRTDVEKICNYFMPQPKPIGSYAEFKQFWGKAFAEK